MNAYLDSSILLRVILGETHRLESWREIDVAVSSELIRVECLRTIDRARIQLQLADEAVSRHRADVLAAIGGIDLIPLATPVLGRAAEPFPTSLGSLDALHLASGSWCATGVPICSSPPMMQRSVLPHAPWASGSWASQAELSL